VKRADYVIALSADIESFYREFNQNIDIIPVFIDDEVFVPKDIANRINDNHRVVGIIGPFEKGNINNHFIDFIRDNLDCFDPRIRFKVIGKIDEDLKFKSERVEYTGYLDSVKEYVRSLNELDSVIVPSIAESYGALNKILEPMTLGKIVYTTPLGHKGLDNVTSGKEIFVTEEKDMADLVNKTIFDHSICERLGTAAMHMIAENYSKTANLKKIDRVLLEMNESI
jgi:glycosyltransferase involved in cell wall biosynthesis